MPFPHIFLTASSPSAHSLPLHLPLDLPTETLNRLLSEILLPQDTPSASHQVLPLLISSQVIPVTSLNLFELQSSHL